MKQKETTIDGPGKYVCVVKISVTSETDRYHVDDVVYYRSGMSPDFAVRWSWYFEYLAALVKVRNPKRAVFLSGGRQDILLGKEWHDYRREVLLKSRQRKLKQLNMPVVDDDLFGFKSQDNEAKKAKVSAEIDALVKDIYPISEFPEYINKIKDYV